MTCFGNVYWKMNGLWSKYGGWNVEITWSTIARHIFDTPCLSFNINIERQDRSYWSLPLFFRDYQKRRLRRRRHRSGTRWGGSLWKRGARRPNATVSFPRNSLGFESLIWMRSSWKFLLCCLLTSHVQSEATNLLLVLSTYLFYSPYNGYFSHFCHCWHHPCWPGSHHDSCICYVL